MTTSIEERVRVTLRGFVSDLTAASILRLAIERGALDARSLELRDAEPLLSGLAQGIGVFVPDAASRRRCLAELARALGLEAEAEVGAVAQEERQLVPIETEADVLTARAVSRRMSRVARLETAGEAQVVTAVSELAHNILSHAGAGEVRFHASGAAPGFVEIVARDHGPGIAQLDAVLEEAARARGARRGIAGVRASMDEFAVSSARGRGTEVRVRKVGVAR